MPVGTCTPSRKPTVHFSKVPISHFVQLDIGPLCPKCVPQYAPWHFKTYAHFSMPFFHALYASLPASAKRGPKKGPVKFSSDLVVALGAQTERLNKATDRIVKK